MPAGWMRCVARARATRDARAVRRRTAWQVGQRHDPTIDGKGRREMGEPEMLSPKLRRDILDVLAQTAGFTLIGALIIETALRFH